MTAPGGGDAATSRTDVGPSWWAETGRDRSTSAPTRRTTGGTGPVAPSGRPTEAADPVRVRIPAIGVAAPVEPLGLDGERELAPPGSPWATGWWRDGPEPGEPGPAVLVGHYDSGTGPAVFHRLADLRPGDRVDVDRADGSTVSFTVRRLTAHPRDDFPTERVYGDTGGRAALRLITCGGSYDRAAGRYTENLVVLAEEATAARGR
ncbi:class F sortase [Streptomyces sp. TRM43335]|uniref:Class F sortase n=1 Tax=Streptomyces taklimakanensis TaxID=2569853 RepID=A0A6G2B6F2_9ACTN|nr:class F sortase [Streptomyces taklimakanensis]MTE17804.1 class F sortase [Streptomyces taklimakanensis]